MASKSEKALAVVTATPPKVQGLHFLKTSGKALAKRLQLVRKADHEAAFHALCVGVLLWQAKSQSKHGDFKDWIARHVTERAYRTCVDYMKLSLVLAEKAHLTREEVVAMLALKPKGAKSADAKTAAAKLDGFIGELSVHELMIKHGVRGVGLKSELTAGDNAPAALTDAENAQLQLDLIWSQAYEPAKSLADLLAEKASALTPEQRGALETELKKALQALRSA